MQPLSLLDQGPNLMPRYIFSFDQQNNSFPERYRVVGADDDAESLREAENLTGTVIDAEALAFLEQLVAKFQADEAMTVEFVDAPDWNFVELRFNPAKAAQAETRPRTP
jgi:hypothetical protein